MPQNAPQAPKRLFLAALRRAYRRRRQRRQLDVLIRRCERETFAEGEALKWRLRLKRK